MTASPLWEEIEVPRGQFIGWGPRPGQEIVGKVLSFAPTSGTDFAGAPCPQLALELVADCDSYVDKGATRQQIASGELVVLNAGQVNLKKAVLAAQPVAGDLIKITFANLVKVQTPNGSGEVKEFVVKIARGAGGPATPKPAAAAQTSSAPPF